MTDTPYETLTPDIILEAIETLGHLTDGTLTALNSYENRVYQIGLEDGEPIIAKFYRPDRWTDECIREEHDFTQELLENEIPCVAPLSVDGQTLFRVPDTEFRFALFPRRAGRPPNIEDRDVLSVMGRALARIHSTGGSQHFTHRPSLTSQRLGHESRAFLLSSNFIPTELVDAYESITEHLLQRIDTFFADQPASVFTETAIWAICCGVTTRLTSSISTIHRPGHRYRICGCFYQGRERSKNLYCPTYSKRTRCFARSIFERFR